ncbi:class I SAM-dependent methyltransferase [Streptomyces sp. NBC_01294]|uniref:class I SAM-dependent methyltransferase n=1 Tax=Streptomyces sp. NBC_01294 TaxID=2903815 RepID=UPI002DD88FED|nr:class I SAM-dependent methyltransferase [Streptomyces sp. NBC_01294]WRZ58737.1 class I SAM-dependent methyltransferase [Streptomyces sp. NBC_01294]
MTAHLYWDEVWRTDGGRADWSRPHPWVVDEAARLQALGAKDVLDLGCGVGRHALFYAEQGLVSSATDRSPEAVRVGLDESAKRGVNIAFEVADFTELPYPDASFDLVLAFNVVYHNDEAGLARVLAEVRRVLRPGGVYQSTMLSKRNGEYGRGDEVSPNTFCQPGAPDDKVHPHMYVDAADLVRLHEGFRLLSATDAEHEKPGSFHWHCVFDTPGQDVAGTRHGRFAQRAGE